MIENLTPKAQKTRQRILDIAIEQFTEHGFENATMRDIAEAADCSLGLIYRYFSSKEMLVLALWAQMANELVAAIDELPEGTLADRFLELMLVKCDQLLPYRDVLNATLSAALNPQSGVGVVSADTVAYKQQVIDGLERLVAESSDAPRDPPQFAIILYAIHLLTTMVWMYDASPNQHYSRQLLEFVRDMMGLARPLLWMPPATRLMARLATIVEGIFSPERA